MEQKKIYSAPSISCAHVAPAHLLTMSTGTDSMDGSTHTGPGTSEKQEEAAKKNSFSFWDDEEDSDDSHTHSWNSSLSCML